MASVAELAVLFKADTKALDSAVDGMGGKFGKLGSALAGAGIGAAAGKAAQAVVGIGTAFDDVYDGMVVKTGATGAELASLQESFRSVVANVPTDFATAGDAVSTLNQRLGITGQPLTDLSTQMANLARITGTDVATNANAAADVIAKFGLDANDAGGFMDALFARSQQSGVSFAELADTMGRSAGQLKMFGLSAADSAGFVATMEKAGLNTTAILKGMTKFAKDGGAAFKDLETAEKKNTAAQEALNKAQQKYNEVVAKSGPGSEQAAKAHEALAKAQNKAEGTTRALGKAQDAAKTASGPMIDQFRNEVQALADLGAGTEQSRRAMEIFGPKAGPELANALNQGVLSVQDLVNNMGPVEQGINETATATDDMQQKFDLLKNKVMLAAEGFAPLGMTLQPFVSMLPMMGGAIGALAPVITGSLIPALGGAASAALAAVPAFVAMVAPFLPIILAIGALIAIGVLLYKHWDDVKAAAAALASWLKEKWDAITSGIGAALSALWDNIKATWETIKTTISDTMQAIWDNIVAAWEGIKKSVSGLLSSMWETLKGKWAEYSKLITDKMKEIADTIKAKWEEAKQLVTDALDAIAKTVSTVWGAILGVITSVVGAVREVIDTGFNLVRSIVKSVMDAIRDAIDLAWNVIKAVFQTAVDLIKGIVSGFMQILHGDISGGMETIKAAFSGAWERMKAIVSTAIDGIADIARGLIQRVKDAIGDAGDALAQVGRDLIGGIRKGIEEKWEDLKAWFRGLLGGLVSDSKAELGEHSPSTVFAEIGMDIAAGLAVGLAAGGSLVRAAMRDLLEGDVLGTDFAAAISKLYELTPGTPIADLKTGIGAGSIKAPAQTLMEYIKSLGWSDLGQTLRKFTQTMAGLDDATREMMDDLHKARTERGWATPEARELFRRRVMPFIAGNERRRNRGIAGSTSSESSTAYYPGEVPPPDRVGLVAPIPVGSTWALNPDEVKIGRVEMPNIQFSPVIALDARAIAGALVTNMTWLDIIVKAVDARQSIRVSTTP